jgi:HD superfamily phosphohydrolase
VADDHLAIHVGALEAVEGYLLARFHMYKQVYLHKTSRSAERMLEAMLRRAKALKLAAEGPRYWPEGALGLLILGEPLTPPMFGTLDDHDIWLALKRWASDPDPWLAALAGGLSERRLYKPLLLPNDKARADELVHAAEAVARVRGFLPETTVLVDSSRDSLYRPFVGSTRDREDGESIRLIEVNGAEERVVFIEERSEVVRMLANLEVRQRLLCVHPELRDPIARALGRTRG